METNAAKIAVLEAQQTNNDKQLERFISGLGQVRSEIKEEIKSELGRLEKLLTDHIRTQKDAFKRQEEQSASKAEARDNKERIEQLEDKGKIRDAAYQDEKLKSMKWMIGMLITVILALLTTTINVIFFVLKLPISL
jgi:hypothetical protein